MRDDFEDTPRRQKKEGSKDNTLKVLLIVFGSFFGLMLLVCCGGGAYLYYMGKRFVEQAAMSKPADIQKLTTEIADITIPPEFTPQFGSSVPLIGMKMVHYGWCPAGNCPTVTDPGSVNQDNVLSLTSFNIGENAGGDGVGDADFDDSMMADDYLKTQWKEYVKTEHTFDIRGKASKFYIVQGEEFAVPQYEFDEEASELPAQAEPVVTTEIDPAVTPEIDPVEPAETENMPETSPPVSQAGTGKKIVQITGNFPGKEAQCTLRVRLKAEDYDEQKLLDMLKSIR